MAGSTRISIRARRCDRGLRLCDGPLEGALAQAGRTDPARKRLATIVNSYLTSVHRDDPGHGCAIPTLGAEIARESPRTRKAFAAKMDQMIEMLEAQMPGDPRKAARKQAVGTLATMMGTIVLARIAGSGEFSDEVLGAGREAALDRGARRSRRRRNRAPRNAAAPARQ